MNMDRLTTEERAKIIKTYYEKGDSNMGTFRALRGDHGRHNRSTVQDREKLLN